MSEVNSNKHQPMFLFILLVCVGYIGFQQHRIENITQSQINMIEQNAQKQINEAQQIIIPRKFNKRKNEEFEKQIIVLFEPSIKELGTLINLCP